MRGTLFQKPLEWSVEVMGEQWRQGDQIQGRLKVKNHGMQAVDLSKMGVALAVGDLKKVRKKDEAAFDIAEKKFFDAPVKSGAEKEFEWKFTLDKNGPITDKSASPYLLFGNIESPQESGQLQITVSPTQLFDQFFELFENFHRFKVKEKKYKKGKIEAKLLPPGSKEFASVDGLTLSLSTDEQDLKLEYVFKVKKLEYGGTDVRDVKAKASNVKEKQTLNPKEYLIFGDALDQDKVIKKIAEVLDKVKSKSLI